MDEWFAVFDDLRTRFDRLSPTACRRFIAGAVTHAYRELRQFFATIAAADYLADLDAAIDALWMNDDELSEDRIDALFDATADMDAGPNPNEDWVQPRGWSQFLSAVQAGLQAIGNAELGRSAYGAARGAFSARRAVRRVWDRAIDPDGRLGYSDAEVAESIGSEIRFQLTLLDRLERGESVGRAECD